MKNLFKMLKTNSNRVFIKYHMGNAQYLPKNINVKVLGLNNNKDSILFQIYQNKIEELKISENSKLLLSSTVLNEKNITDTNLEFGSLETESINLERIFNSSSLTIKNQNFNLDITYGTDSSSQKFLKMAVSEAQIIIPYKSKFLENESILEEPTGTFNEKTISLSGESGSLKLNGSLNIPSSNMSIVNKKIIFSYTKPTTSYTFDFDKSDKNIYMQVSGLGDNRETLYFKKSNGVELNEQEPYTTTDFNGIFYDNTFEFEEVNGWQGISFTPVAQNKLKCRVHSIVEE